MKLRYSLIGRGWAKIELELGGSQTMFLASYLSDALDDLCGAVAALLYGDPEATARFWEEPGETRLRLDRLGHEKVRVRVRRFDDYMRDRPDAAGETLLDAEVRLRTFAGALVSELQRLLREHGETGYRALWGNADFPRRRLDQLQSLLAM